MRVLAGRLGCPQGLWAHLGEDEERRRLVEYCHAVLDELPKRGLFLDEYLSITRKSAGIGEGNVVLFTKRSGV